MSAYLLEAQNHTDNNMYMNPGYYHKCRYSLPYLSKRTHLYLRKITENNTTNYFVCVRECIDQSETICECIDQSETMCEYIDQSETICEYIDQSETICECIDQSESICEYIDQSETICECIDQSETGVVGWEIFFLLTFLFHFKKLNM